MTNPDGLIYAVHAAFWAAFALVALVRRGAAGGPPAASANVTRSAPFSRAALSLHALAFVVLYWGLGRAILPGRVPHWLPGQQILGTVVMVAGAALACWALVSFHSWRLRAKVDVGHQLATGGPFHWLRHPIYLALDLFALGSALWVPTPAVWIGVLLMVAGGEWRARIEERLLADTFGAAYTSYCARTARFVPGVY